MRNGTIRCSLFLATIGLWASGPCWGDLATWTDAAVRTTDTQVCVDQDGAAATCSLGLQPKESFLSVASSNAGYGALQVHTQIGLGGAEAIAAHGWALFSDVLTVSGFAGSGFIAYDFSFEDRQSATPATPWTTHADVAMTDVVTPDLIQMKYWPVWVDGLSLGPFPFAVTFPITAGKPASLYVILEAFSQLGPGDDGQSRFMDASVDFTGASVFDAQMQPVHNFAIASQSGFLYVAPEPHSLWLLLTCIGAVALCARARSVAKRR